MRELFPNADPLALDLLGKILEFDPAKRINAEEALKHQYLQMDTVTRGVPIDMEEFAFERRSHTIQELRTLFLEEILKYHPERRDEYLRPGDQPVLRYAPVDQASRFREAMTAQQNGIEPPRAWESMPNQRLTNYYQQAVGGSNHSQAGSVVQQGGVNGGAVTASTDGAANGVVGTVPGAANGTQPNGMQGNVVVRTTGTMPPVAEQKADASGQQDVAIGYSEDHQLPRYGGKFSSVGSASSTVAFRQASGELGANPDRRVSETLESMTDIGQEIVADVNENQVSS